MKLIKKSSQPVLNQAETTAPAEELIVPADSEDIEEPVIAEKQAQYINNSFSTNYIPVRDHPVVQSVGKSGWQVSDIWRDIRIDNFCD